MDVLEEQVANKNSCIDYLTGQLEIVEGNSSDLLSVIESLERRLEGMERGVRLPDHWQQPLTTFSDSQF